MSSVFEQQQLFFEEESLIAQGLDILLRAEWVEEVFLQLSGLSAREVDLRITANGTEKHNDLGLKEESAVGSAFAFALLRDSFEYHPEEGSVF